MLGDTGNKRAVRILLECNLVIKSDLDLVGYIYQLTGFVINLIFVEGKIDFSATTTSESDGQSLQ